MPLPMDAHRHTHERCFRADAGEDFSAGDASPREHACVLPTAGREAQTPGICEVGAGGASRRQALPAADPDPLCPAGRWAMTPLCATVITGLPEDTLEVGWEVSGLIHCSLEAWFRHPSPAHGELSVRPEGSRDHSLTTNLLAVGL